MSFQARTVGLQLPPDLSFERWRELGPKFGTLANAAQWIIGDWVVHGSRFAPFGSRYEHALSLTRLDYDTLRGYAWVARRFELARRRRGLSFKHHEAVAALPRPEQDGWLDRAESEGWSVHELRRRVRASRGAGEPKRIVVRLSLTEAEHVRFTAAARDRGLDLRPWLLELADAAARPESRHLVPVRAS